MARTPVISAPSSAKNSGEWFTGTVFGSRSLGVTPRKKKIPGIFFFLGVTPKDRDPATVPVNHSPLFFADEGALITGVRAMTGLAVDYLTLPAGKKAAN